MGESERVMTVQRAAKPAQRREDDRAREPTDLTQEGPTGKYPLAKALQVGLSEQRMRFCSLKTLSMVLFEVKSSMPHSFHQNYTQTQTYQPRRQVCISHWFVADRGSLPRMWVHRLCHTDRSSCIRTWICLFSYLSYWDGNFFWNQLSIWKKKKDF